MWDEAGVMCWRVPFLAREVKGTLLPAGRRDRPYMRRGSTRGSKDVCSRFAVWGDEVWGLRFGVVGD